MPVLAGRLDFDGMPSGDWLSRRGGHGLDLGALGGASEFGVDGLVCRSVLSDLQRDAPPRFEDAQAAAAAAAARWEAPAPPDGPAVRRAPRSRSTSRGPDGAAAPRRTRPPNPRTPPLAPLPAVRSTASPSSGSGAPPLEFRGRGADDTLVTSLASRLSQVEQLNKRLSAKVAEQSQEITELHARLESGSHHPADGTEDNASGGAAPSTEAALRTECEELKAQLADMRAFLAEYGLKWVPRTSSDADANGRGSAPARARDDSSSVAEQLGRPRAPGGVSVDIQVIESRVEGLNALVEEEGGAGVGQCIGNHGHPSAMRRSSLPLPLTFFCDGVKLGERAFVPYELPSAQELLKDILDGYFPKALREEHPGGVALKVVDRTGNRFSAWLRDLARDDPDLADGGERLRPAVGMAVNAPRDNRTAGERLLDKLPERVVRDGRVLEIRGPLAAQLAPGRAAAAAAGGAGQRQASAPPGGAGSGRRQEEVFLLRAGRDPAEPVARLQVRLESGQRVLLSMEPSATLGALWAALEVWRKDHGVPQIGNDGKRYSLRSAFPPRTFSDHEQTLADSGLTPSATLFVSAEAADC